MVKGIILAIILLSFSALHLHSQNFTAPDTVSVQSGKLILKGLLWRPAGTGKFPAIIFCHGSYGGSDTIHDPLKQTVSLAPVFAMRGYIFFVLFRRGAGLSKGQGVNSTDLMDKAFRKGGRAARNVVQLKQLETDQLNDMLSGIGFLVKRGDVDKNRIAIVGHSFGGSLALIVAQRCPDLRAVVAFSPGGYSWDYSKQLRTRLINAVGNVSVPVMIIHAQNDYSVNPGYALDSVLNRLKKPHILQVYPTCGNSADDGHNFIFGNIDVWKGTVLKFLEPILMR